jgi:hypothetical protein
MSDDEEEETQQTNKSLALPMAASSAMGLSRGYGNLRHLMAIHAL